VKVVTLTIGYRKCMLFKSKSRAEPSTTGQPVPSSRTEVRSRFTSRRKKSYCQNCHYPLAENYNFCPHCGQDNSDKLVSFWTLVYELFSNLIAYDSRMLRTVRPFLFKPGFLTQEFIAGRRVKYMHPLRLYFIISFFYFLALSITISRETEDLVRPAENRTELSPADAGQPDADSINLTIRSNSPPQTGTKDIEYDGKITIFGDQKLSLALLKNQQTTPAMVLDSLGWQHNRLTQHVAGQLLKFARSEGTSIGRYFRDYMLSKASIVMFFLVPVFALLLKLVYIRRKRYYVEHLTFSLHLHAFVFFILLLMFLISDIDWLSNLLSLALLVYVVLGFRRYYQQGWFKTFGKITLLSFCYLICFSTAIAIMIIIGGLLY
jgi:hypothetical protein